MISSVWHPRKCHSPNKHNELFPQATSIHSTRSGLVHRYKLQGTMKHYDWCHRTCDAYTSIHARHWYRDQMDYPWTQNEMASLEKGQQPPRKNVQTHHHRIRFA